MLLARVHSRHSPRRLVFVPAQLSENKLNIINRHESKTKTSEFICCLSERLIWLIDINCELIIDFLNIEIKYKRFFVVVVVDIIERRREIKEKRKKIERYISCTFNCAVKKNGFKRLVLLLAIACFIILIDSSLSIRLKIYPLTFLF